ncbi:DUF465 domain-containing protein [Vibrio sp. SM6]|uniref:DUF465 domain-containing protein n=1 Tax=Vibrio agarilyticus TaxID=2726741 RepID=A0A7X8TRY2_9VIBR|nr:DUF465 domain-containing protein [Vibrio agarilyticus]NLS13775.1 DUF465 domain-containing protein [Vibrio agarilyticus]
MLGEVHSLELDFPEMKDVIATLIATDHDFANDNKNYNELDRKIRKLELNDSPVSDEEMTHMKLERAEMKDSLYGRLLRAKE